MSGQRDSPNSSPRSSVSADPADYRLYRSQTAVMAAIRQAVAKGYRYYLVATTPGGEGPGGGGQAPRAPPRPAFPRGQAGQEGGRASRGPAVFGPGTSRRGVALRPLGHQAPGGGGDAERRGEEAPAVGGLAKRGLASHLRAQEGRGHGPLDLVPHRGLLPGAPRGGPAPRPEGGLAPPGGPPQDPGEPAHVWGSFPANHRHPPAGAETLGRPAPQEPRGPMEGPPVEEGPGGLAKAPPGRFRVSLRGPGGGRRPAQDPGGVVGGPPKGERVIREGRDRHGALSEAQR